MRPPIEHVAIFDEAQRAWNCEQTTNFMLRKKKRSGFNQSEPEFLISCLDRHSDWAVVICLVGGGQEINTGEAGIGEWIDSVLRSYPGWHLFISSRMVDNEYAAGHAISKIREHGHFTFRDELHLSVSMRSFRAENVSNFVKHLLDIDIERARDVYAELSGRYPIVTTRDLQKAKRWIKERARGSERYGIVVSSEAQRLKPHAIDVRTKVDPIHWFLGAKEDVRSSYYLEDVATEFQIQGLELDWTCVTWDADFRLTETGWGHWSFCGDRWNRIRKPERQAYLKNAYRVLLTRARQGMVIVVPEGDREDPTRNPDYYDRTFNYLQEIGLPMIS
ncbi:MAG: DNA/RNA helicase domain-containing protein [Planctomycetaceae bacterium]